MEILISLWQIDPVTFKRVTNPFEFNQKVNSNNTAPSIGTIAR